MLRFTQGRAAANATAEAGAVAMTIGTEYRIFHQGAFDPGTQRGDALLAHELAHVQQQRAAAKAQDAPVTPGWSGRAQPTKKRRRAPQAQPSPDSGDGSQKEPRALPKKRMTLCSHRYSCNVVPRGPNRTTSSILIGGGSACWPTSRRLGRGRPQWSLQSLSTMHAKRLEKRSLSRRRLRSRKLRINPPR